MHLFVLSNTDHFTCSYISLTFLSSSHSTLLLSRHLTYLSIYWCSLSFSLLIILAPFTNSLLLIHAPNNLTLQYKHDAMRCLIPFLPLLLHPFTCCILLQHIFLHYHQIYHAHYFHYVLATNHSGVLMQTFVLKVCITHTITLLPLSFSPETPNPPALVLSPPHLFKCQSTPNIYSLLLCLQALSK